MLIIPPRTSHKLHLLDRTVYNSLKSHWNSVSSDQTSEHPGGRMNISDVCGILSKAFPRAFQPEMIQNGFKVSGIFLFDKNVFNENEFLASYPTN